MVDELHENLPYPNCDMIMFNLQLLHLWQCFPFAILVETHIVKVIDLQEEIRRQICHVDQNNPLMARK
jgi:hypothetical protein